MILISNKKLVKYITFGFARAITFFPFVLVDNAILKNDKQLINHEKIHLRQQLEMAVLPFYLWYLVEFLIRYIKYKSRYQAYLTISFEKEAFSNEAKPDYLKKRKFWAFIRYI